MIEQQVGNFKRRVEFQPAFDKRNTNPTKNYGINGMSLRFILIGDKGATQFLVYTNMQLPEVAEELFRKQLANPSKYNFNRPMGADIGYHAKTPQYDGQPHMECDLMPEGKCYYDGSSLQAEDFMPTFLSSGDDAVWAMLEERYNDQFNGEESE